MRHSFQNSSRTPIALALLVLALVGGCKSDGSCGVDKCADIPQGAIPQPNGTFACQWQTAQVARAHEDHFMIYQNEWYLGGKELGEFGQRHVADIATQIKGTPFKVAVEPYFDTQRNAPDDELNKARVEAVARNLAMHGIDDAFDRVILALPHAEGLRGDEAVRIGSQQLQNSGLGGGTNSGGPFGGTGTTSAGGGFGGIGGGIGGGF